MVLAERNTTDVVRNGRRSRGPSPNTHTTGGVTNSASLVGSGNNSGHSGNANANEKTTTAVPGAGTPESSDDDNSTKRNGKSKAKQSEYEEKIRVGRDYQAVCPPLVPEAERRPEQMNERALLVWSPTKEIPDLKLEEYISVAKEKYGYNGEQALGMLFWHKHDLERAVMDLANFTPFPDEWTIEDKVLFEQAFQFHGKSFHRIRQMLPDKSIASLVKYYYSWKKTRHRSSAMDRQEKAIKAVVKDGSENGSEVGSNEESDNDDKKNRQVMEQLDKECETINVDDVLSKPAAANTESAQPRISARWLPDEIQVALLAIREYGKNFPTIAKVVATKTEAHVRTFYLNNRRRYNLDQIVKEYEAGKSEESGAEEQTEPAVDAAAAGAATASAPSAADSTSAASATADRKQSTENSNNGVETMQESLPKKEDPKKPELAAAVLKIGVAEAADAVATVASSTASGVIGAATSASKPSTSATITIIDESDTATNSSSDVVTTGLATSTGSSALSSTTSAPASKTQTSSEELSAQKSNPASGIAAIGAATGGGQTANSSGSKRDSSVLPVAEQPPAKKIALSTGGGSSVAEFLAN
uniref:Isoform 3 of REST corepressor n=1 Tax=Drosophila melanogaster TaxID=7227 RepID=Q59E36-4|nr:CoRest, isoform E [Drosophila melanogaster]AAX52508.1 CoRest, isoform E [Drosophila melanogaster]|eukprot:NP_001014753.1 CoRest, isoform E [Drosophila melanogaster]